MLVVGPATPPLGIVSHEFQIGSDGDSFETLRQPGFDGVRLDDIREMSYSTFVQMFGSGGQAPYLLLNLDNNNDGVFDLNNGDDQLFFEPVYQDATFFPSNAQGPLALNTWQTWDALNGGWWSLNGVCGATPGTGVKSILDYLPCAPDATIRNAMSGAGGFRVATGCGGAAWQNFIGNTDNVTFASDSVCVTYDFDPTTTTTTTTTTTVPVHAPPGKGDAGHKKGQEKSNGDG